MLCVHHPSGSDDAAQLGCGEDIVGMSLLWTVHVVVVVLRLYVCESVL